MRSIFWLAIVIVIVFCIVFGWLAISRGWFANEKMISATHNKQATHSHSASLLSFPGKQFSDHQKKTPVISIPDNKSQGGVQTESRITIAIPEGINIDGVNVKKVLKDKVVESNAKKDKVLDEAPSQ